jgi:hypothetical protein
MGYLTEMFGDNFKKQNKQMSEFNTARVLAKEGKVNDAIEILERIMYKDGLVIRGVGWPFILSDIYIKNKMYDKCWKYLDYLSVEHIASCDKIREIQAKILKIEKKFLDALAMKMAYLLYKYTSVGFKPTLEKVEKNLCPYMKNAKLLDKRTELIDLYSKHIALRPFNESVFRKEFISIVK